MLSEPASGAARTGAGLTEAEVRALCATELARWPVRGKRILLIVPDHTRTAPIDLLFKLLHDLIAPEASAFDVMIALGTHPPLSEESIRRRLGITLHERESKYRRTRFYNHDWSDPARLVSIGTIPEDDVAAISLGLMHERVDVTLNETALDYDLLILLGPTFPHEVVGFSGGNKYLFPGISGKPIIDMFHWLGALITNPAIIGAKHTPVRQIIDRAASMVPVLRMGISLVVDGERLVGLYAGTPEAAWSRAAALSSEIHIRYEDRAYDSVLSCAPSMYDELWVGGKCAYKIEPVVADGGELIIYAPHIGRVSSTHGAFIREIGYHVRDYFVKQSARFAHVPRGVMAHSTHVKGIGTYDGGDERPRIQVVLATQLSEAECRALNLGYRDYRAIDLDAWRDRKEVGRLLVPKAGETLHLPRKHDFRRFDAVQMGDPR